MKKIFIFYILFCLILSFIIVVPNKKIVFADIGEINSYGEYCFYTSGSYDIEDCICIRIGSGTIIQTNLKNAEKIKRLINNIQGESYCFKSDKLNVVNDILNLFKANTVETQKIDDLEIIYAYTSKLDSYVYENEDKINLQICKNGLTITVGYPIILGSY